MAVVLAYTSPAIGHLFPFCALLGELAARGHEIHVRTLESSAAAGWGCRPACRSPDRGPAEPGLDRLATSPRKRLSGLWP